MELVTHRLTSNVGVRLITSYCATLSGLAPSERETTLPTSSFIYILVIHPYDKVSKVFTYSTLKRNDQGLKSSIVLIPNMPVFYFHEKQPLGPKHVSALGLPMMPISNRDATETLLTFTLFRTAVLSQSNNTTTTRDDFRCET